MLLQRPHNASYEDATNLKISQIFTQVHMKIMLLQATPYVRISSLLNINTTNMAAMRTLPRSWTLAL